MTKEPKQPGQGTGTAEAEAEAKAKAAAGARAEESEAKAEGAGEAEDAAAAEAAEPEESAETEPGKADAAEDTDAAETGEAGEKDADKKAEPEESESARYMRLMADFQNYKKRVEKEKKDIYAYANENLAGELLTVLDNFERALEHDGEEKSFKEGMEMIFKQLFGVLEKAGLEEIAALGEDFDPNFHNAVMNEDTDEYESGKVSGVMQKGYTLNGKVIRPSMVKVAQ